MFSVFALFLTMQMTTHVGPMTSGTPAVEPHMAVNGSTVALTFGAGHVIYSDVSHDSGRTFSGPVKVAEAPILPLSMHRGPRIAFTEDAIVITAVVGKIDAHEYGKPADGNLMAWRSTDGGKTWSKGVAINDVPAAPSEGLPALASNGKQKLFAAWLDPVRLIHGFATAAQRTRRTRDRCGTASNSRFAPHHYLLYLSILSKKE